MGKTGKPLWSSALVGRLLILVLLSGASVAVLNVKGVADRAARDETMVLRTLAEVRLQDALEWRAISGGSSEDLEAQHATSVDNALAMLLGTAFEESTTTRLISKQRTYAAAVAREFQLLDSGRVEQAVEWDETRVDPAAETLLEDLEAVATRLASISRTASRWTGAGLIATLLAALGLMMLLQRRRSTDAARNKQQVLMEARYRTIIDRSRDLVMVCDREGELGYVSPAAQRVLGGDAPPDQWPSLVEALPADDQSRLRELLAETIRNGEAGPVDLRLATCAAKEVAGIHQFTARDLSDDPSVRGIVLTAQDVTSARELDQIQRDFVSTVSHDLRTPLTAICGYLELVQAEDFGPVSDELRSPIAAVERNARRLLGMVTGLLFLAGHDTGLTAAAQQRLDLVEFVSDLVTDARVVHAGRRLDLDLTDAPQGAQVLGVRDDLERLIGNLLANAIKFSPGGEAVTVGLAVRPEGIELWVTDHGIGIPVEEQPRLFERFFRSSLAQHHAVPGTGLGLAICKAVVDAHAGSISINSHAGEGTTVLVRLPLAAADEPVHARLE